jgi:RimJ/RimL family protein N-acetyltransferase
MNEIRTMRLRLISVEPHHKHSLAAGKPALARLLGVAVPDDWPQFPEAFVPTPDAMSAAAAHAPWGGYFFIDVDNATLVGNGGFHGPPNDAGEVEIGYEIAGEYRGRGYAIEAVRALIAFAFEDARVRFIVAHTLAQENASNAVLVKAAFSFVAELANAEVGALWRWELPRS